MSRVDLHIHSTASDGKFTPEEIVRTAAERGLTVIALADHDTVDGIAPALKAAKAFPELTVIPGIEVSTQFPGSEVHVLGYFIDFTDPEIRAALINLRDSRLERAKEMIAKLKGLGVHIDWQRVKEIAGSGTLGRPHIAQAMMEKGYLTSFKEAFDRYIGQHGPAYVDRLKITPVEAVSLILKGKGLPVLAHPLTISDPEMMIAKLKSAGLVGMEAYYKDYTEGERNSLARLARKYNLIATGGSDYHGLDANTETMIGDTDVPIESAEQLIALAEQRALKLASS